MCPQTQTTSTNLFKLLLNFDWPNSTQFLINGPIILLATFFWDTLYDHRVQYLQKHLRQHKPKWHDLYLPLFGVTSSISGIVSPDPWLIAEEIAFPKILQPGPSCQGISPNETLCPLVDAPPDSWVGPVEKFLLTPKCQRWEKPHKRLPRLQSRPNCQGLQAHSRPFTSPRSRIWKIEKFPFHWFHAQYQAVANGTVSGSM